VPAFLTNNFTVDAANAPVLLKAWKDDAI